MLSLNNEKLIATTSFINGAWLPQGGHSFEVRNPATDAVIATINAASTEQTFAAIAAAKAALPHWQQYSAKARAAILRTWHDLIRANQDDLATILSAEQGKTLAEARAEIAYGASYIEWFAETAKRLDGDIIQPPSPDKRLLVIKQAVGVVAAITPWNFPNAMISRKLAPALAAGCTVVAKPAHETPLSALALCVLAQQAGIPAGVINMVVGTDAQAIVRSDDKSPRRAQTKLYRFYRRRQTAISPMRSKL